MHPTCTKFIREPDLITADMDGETVMMSVQHGEYLGLNRVASRVWELLAEPSSVDTLVARICAEFDVDPATCASDLQAFTQELLDNGLVRPA